MTDETQEIPIPFTVIHETHDRRAFQSEGHSLPALRASDIFGEPDFDGPQREWGDTVHILRVPSLTTTAQKPGDVSSGSPNPPSQDILRQYSDSFDDALALLRKELPRHYQALWRAQFIRDFGRIERIAQLERQLANLRELCRSAFSEERITEAMHL